METNAVFKLVVLWEEGKIQLPVELESNTLGYFSSLEMIESFISSAIAGKQKNFYLGKCITFRIFEVTKYYLNQGCEPEGQWVYDCNGQLIGGYDGPDTAPFFGRSEDQCRFKNGDPVIFLQGNRLLSGKIAALPISKAPDRVRLDQSDDCYLVTTGPESENHSHPWIHRVFAENGTTLK